MHENESTFLVKALLEVTQKDNPVSTYFSGDIQTPGIFQYVSDFEMNTSATPVKDLNIMEIHTQ